MLSTTRCIFNYSSNSTTQKSLQEFYVNCAKFQQIKCMIIFGRTIRTTPTKLVVKTLEEKCFRHVEICVFEMGTLAQISRLARGIEIACRQAKSSLESRPSFQVPTNGERRGKRGWKETESEGRTPQIRDRGLRKARPAGASRGGRGFRGLWAWPRPINKTTYARARRARGRDGGARGSETSEKWPFEGSFSRIDPRFTCAPFCPASSVPTWERAFTFFIDILRRFFRLTFINGHWDTFVWVIYFNIIEKFGV